MSSHYIYINCKKCSKSESLYTGEIFTDDFDDDDWEGEYIPVPLCKECKGNE
jgi:hypothetical protein